MLENIRLSKILWFASTGLAFCASLAGIITPRIYDGVFAPEFIPGALPQDILTVLLCLPLAYLIAGTGEKDIRKQVIITGVIGSFAYLYGIFTIERVYNVMYLIYLAVFAVSVWSTVHTLASTDKSAIGRINAAGLTLHITALFALLIAVLFTVLWTLALLPLMQNHNRIEYLYSIYILDLAFVMPSFFITAILSLKKKGVGRVFLPAVYIVGFFVIFPLGLGEVAKSFYGQSSNIPSMAVSFVFSFLMLWAAVAHLKSVAVR